MRPQLHTTTIKQTPNLKENQQRTTYKQFLGPQFKNNHILVREPYTSKTTTNSYFTH
jgi:hypothetical protein